MVGLTGMGGAALVTPLLVVAFGVPAAAAVSSDIVAGATVKMVGSAVHAKRGTVHWRLALWLSVGSVPGVLLGTLLFASALGAPDATGLIKIWLGVVLLVALAVMLVRAQVARRRSMGPPMPEDDRGGGHGQVRRTAAPTSHSNSCRDGTAPARRARSVVRRRCHRWRRQPSRPPAGPLAPTRRGYLTVCARTACQLIKARLEQPLTGGRTMKEPSQ
jgi:hypothetical protein